MLKLTAVRRVVCGLSMVWFASGVSGVRAQSDAGTIHATSRLVILDVRVVDRKGNFVSGLDRTQFQIVEGKAPQTIKNFEGPEAHTAPADAPPINSTKDLEKAGNIPVNVLVLDELNTAFADNARSRQALTKFLQAQPEKLTVPTLFLGVGNSKLAVLHDFTQNRDELLASLKSHKLDMDMIALTNQLAGGTMAAQDGFSKTLGALEQVSASLRGIQGHKNLIWVGSGFDQSYDLTQADDLDEQKIADAIKLVTVRLLEARISLSTLDPAGVTMDSALDESLDAEAQANGGDLVNNIDTDASFDNLAESTGGTVVHGRNDLQQLIQRDASDANDFYTLTYVPTSGSNDAKEYRQIKVVMRDPNLRAITRTGYYPAGVTEAPVIVDKPKDQSREFKYDLASSSTSRMVYTGLHLLAHKAAKGYDVQIESKDLQWTMQDDGMRIAEFTVFGVCFNAKDKALTQAAQEIKERIKPSENTDGTRVGMTLDLAVPFGATRVRIVARDAKTGNIGSLDIPLTK